MSNCVTRFIYGCEVENPEFEDDPERQEALTTLRENVEGSGKRYDTEIGWHHTYDQNENAVWFGAAFGNSVSNGFGRYPAPPTPELIAEVREAWEMLPEHVRKIIGEPQPLVLVVVD